MKAFTHFTRREDKTFHMPPSSAMFSLLVSFLFALAIVLVLSLYVK
jgi:flagellar biogenesis protein FliO